MKEVTPLGRAASSANYCKRTWRKAKGEMAERAHWYAASPAVSNTAVQAKPGSRR